MYHNTIKRSGGTHFLYKTHVKNINTTNLFWAWVGGVILTKHIANSLHIKTRMLFNKNGNMEENNCITLKNVCSPTLVYIVKCYHLIRSLKCTTNY